MKTAIAENKISLDRLNNKLKSATESIINRKIYMQKLFKYHVMRQRDGNMNERLTDMGDIMRSNIY